MIMKIGSTNGTTGAGIFQPQMQQGNDSFSKNIQNQIANAQKQMQELGKNKEMSAEDKMKKCQEIQKQISDLQNQLRQHRQEQRKEQQQSKGSSMDDMLGGSRQAARKTKGGTGMSSASMQAIISADSSMNQVKAQGAVKTDMEGKAGILQSEIKLDEARGGDTTKKREELAEVEAKASDITAAQMDILSDTNEKLEDAAKADQEAARTEGKDKTDKSGKTDKEENKPGTVSDDGTETEAVHNTEEQSEPVDAVPTGASVSTGSVSEPIGSNVDVKL